MRRVLALVLPDLPCELASLARESAVGVAGALSLNAPLAVVLAASHDEVKPVSQLAGVSRAARRFGVFVGQKATAARALVANLDVRRVSPADVSAALSRIAEMALAFGPLASIVAPDNVLLDITGTVTREGSA